MKSWPVVKLSEVLNERREVPDAEALSRGDIKIVSKIGFENGRAELRQELGTKTGMISVRPGDLLLSGINASKGAIAIYGADNNDPVAATIHYGAYSVVPERADITYLWWYLRSNPFREILFRSLPEGIKTELKSKRFLPLEIPLPPLSEQQRVVARIEELASQIHEAQSLRLQADDETNALFCSFLTATLDSSNWPLKLLLEVAEVARGKFTYRPRNEPRFYGGDIPFIQIGDISRSNRYIRTYSQTLNKDGLAITKMFPAGTVAIAITGATIGVTGILGFGSCFPDSIVGIQAKPVHTTPEFIHLAVEQAKKSALAEATQTTQPNINLGNLQRLKVRVPPLPEQRRIVAELDALQAEVDALKRLQAETSAELDALLPSILDKAFKGD